MSRSSRIFCKTTRWTRTSSPEVGSSKIKTGGSWTIVRAIDTFCFIPVDIFEPRVSPEIVHLEPVEDDLHSFPEPLRV